MRKGFESPVSHARKTLENADFSVLQGFFFAHFSGFYTNAFCTHTKGFCKTLVTNLVTNLVTECYEKIDVAIFFCASFLDFSLECLYVLFMT